MVRRTLSRAAICLLIAAGRSTAQATADDARIRELIAAHQRASEQSDLRGLVALYDADAEMIYSNGRVVRGRDAIEAYYRGVIESPATRAGRHHTHPSETIEIRFVTPDVAIVDVASVNVGGTDSTGKAMPDARSLLSTVWRKRDGTWLVVRQRTIPPAPPSPSARAAAAVEQTSPGTKAPAKLVASFDGIGVGFVGPQGTATGRNPSDNSLAVGPNHIVQTVNSRMAIFTKKGRRFDTTGKVLYGPVPTNNVFRGFGGTCEQRNNGDAVVRYDQLADRWLIVMPIFSRTPVRVDEPTPPKSGEPARRSLKGRPGQPGPAVRLYEPPPPPPPPPDSAALAGRGGRGGQPPPRDSGSYAMCYAISTGADPFGPYYRYEFVRPLFPDYPRPAVWPDGYYVPTSTGDDVIQKHACVVDRVKMLAGQDATEQCVIIDDVNFLNNADLDGKRLPPPGAPNIMMAAGGTQLKKIMEDDGIYLWTFHVDWNDPSKTAVKGPTKIPVAPYHYLCDGQLTNCVPQPGTDRRLDAQGDKIMARLVYRRIGNRESLVATHSVNTSAGGGGVRWYEFRVGATAARTVTVAQQGTYAPDGSYRWMASPAIDALGNIGIGYSFGGTPHFAGQRFAGRLAGDPPGTLTLRETVLAEGEAAQTNTLRWEDYSQTAIDPSDDCTIWYVGDYLKKDAASYSTRIGAFRFSGCNPGR